MTLKSIQLTFMQNKVSLLYMVEKWNTNKEGSAPRKILPLEKLENREEK